MSLFRAKAIYTFASHKSSHIEYDVTILFTAKTNSKTLEVVLATPQEDGGHTLSPLWQINFRGVPSITFFAKTGYNLHVLFWLAKNMDIMKTFIRQYDISRHNWFCHIKSCQGSQYSYTQRLDI